MKEELSRLYAAHKERERRAREEMNSTFESEHWEQDKWVGGSWNVLTALVMITSFCVLAGLLYAWWSFGKVWGIV